MIKFALCGNIASGKSAVQKFLENHGYKVLDTDKVAHELLTVNNSELYLVFKNLDVFENGEFSREKLGKLVFADKEIKQKLENILHPQIREKIKEFFEQNQNEKYLFVGIPLLFEAGMTGLFDKIIFIYADDDIRLKRLLHRNGYSVDYAKARLNSQMRQEEKAQKSDYVINNNGSIEELYKNIFKLLEQIR
mgnify:FL=1